MGRGREMEVCCFLPFYFLFYFFFLGGGSVMGTVNQSGTRTTRNRIMTAVFFLPLESSGSKSNNNHLLLSNSTIAMSTRMRFAMN